MNAIFHTIILTFTSVNLCLINMQAATAAATVDINSLEIDVIMDLVGPTVIIAMVFQVYFQIHKNTIQKYVVTCESRVKKYSYSNFQQKNENQEKAEADLTTSLPYFQMTMFSTGVLIHWTI